MPDLAATVGGISVIPPNAHIALLATATMTNSSCVGPTTTTTPQAATSTTDSGLIFAAYQRDPGRQFIPVQQRLAAADALNQWITTIGSATFAILPGIAAGGFIGETLLA